MRDSAVMVGVHFLVGSAAGWEQPDRPHHDRGSSGAFTATIPFATPPGTYFLIACADGFDKVIELDETNNCRSSTSQITITSS